MKKALIAVLTLASVAALGSGAAKFKSGFVKDQDLQLVQPFGPQGPEFGFVRGKFGDKNPASFIVHFKAGADSGWHIHDEDYEAVVIKGTFSEQQQGAQENLLPVGTYFTQAAKQNHRNGCTKDADCVIYVHFDKGANSKPTTPEGKLVAMKPAADAKTSDVKPASTMSNMK